MEVGYTTKIVCSNVLRSETVYTSLAYPALLFDWLITLNLTIVDDIILDKNAGSKIGGYVDFYCFKPRAG